MSAVGIFAGRGFDGDVALNTGILGPCIAGVLAALGGLLNA